MSSHQFLSINGIFMILGYLMLAFIIIWFISRFKYSKDENTKKLFFIGFLFKIACCIGFALIYDFYYQWAGDTYYYYKASQRLGRVLFQDASSYFRILFDLVNDNNLLSLAPGISYTPNFHDTSIYAIHRFMSPFAIISGENYYTENICLAVFLFLINWKFFIFLRDRINCNQTMTFVCIMLIPSAGFWSSAIMKDSFTFSFNLLLIMCFARLFLERKIRISTIFGLLISAYIIMQLKVYILYASIAACMAWLAFTYLKKIKSQFFKFVVSPILAITVAAGGLYVLNIVSSNVGGAFGDVDSMLNKASEAQMDLKQEYYKGHSFDIGDFDGSMGSMIRLAPKAITAGLYRPFLHECESMVMYLSGLENTALLILSIFVFFKAGVKFSIKQIVGNPIVGMCLVFSIILALGIGISTSNFGALVRFKIPLLPLYALGWLEIYYSKKKENEEPANDEALMSEQRPL